MSGWGELAEMQSGEEAQTRVVCAIATLCPPISAPSRPIGAAASLACRRPAVQRNRGPYEAACIPDSS